MKTGYKATYNFKCQNLTYEVGKTYSIDKIQMCAYGFHYCKIMEDVLNYYDLKKDFVLLEVEILGQVIDKWDKSVTDKMKILRVVPKKEWIGFPLIRYNKKGDKTYRKDHWGREQFWRYRYDEKENKIYRKDHYGKEQFWKYDEKGNMIYQKDHWGGEWFWKYDKRGNIIYENVRNGIGRVYKYKYSKTGNKISKKDFYGNEWLWKYDRRGNKIYEKDFYGNEKFYKYDEIGNKIYEKDFCGNEWTITIK